MFLVGIIGKGLNGMAALLGVVLLQFLTPDQIQHVVFSWTRGPGAFSPSL